jgi:large subunit ribosomal protein L25
MDTSLEVGLRDQVGKGNNRKSRSRGDVPAVLYGPTTAPRALLINPNKLLELFKQTNDRNTIVSLQIPGEGAVPCLVREVQRHPVSRDILHVDFYAVPQDREIELMVPLRPVGRPKGAVLGGRLRVIRRDLKVSARFDRIPEAIDVDVSDLDVGDFIRASQIPTPEGVSIVIANDFNVVSLEGKRADTEAAPAAPAAPAEEPKA